MPNPNVKVKKIIYLFTYLAHAQPHILVLSVNVKRGVLTLNKVQVSVTADLFRLSICAHVPPNACSTFQMKNLSVFYILIVRLILEICLKCQQKSDNDQNVWSTFNPSFLTKIKPIKLFIFIYMSIKYQNIIFS